LGVVGIAALALGLDAPASLATSTGFGQAYSPVAHGAWSAFTTPIVFAAEGVLLLFGVWELAAPAGVRPLVALRRIPAVLARADVPGAAFLAGVLACIVVVFSTSDPSRQVLASSAPILLPVGAALVVAFVVRQRRASSPLIEPGALSRRAAWG
ncbi:MAG: MFS transporter, partial [Acidimicrobiales bacterium]